MDREIEKDPISFIREETFMIRKGSSKEVQLLQESKDKSNSSEEVKNGDLEFEEEREKFCDKVGSKKNSTKLYDPVLLEEIEEVFHDAHDYIMSSFIS